MIRVVLADDETLVASSLGTLIGLEDDIDVAAVCGSGEELLEWWRRELVVEEGEGDVGKQRPSVAVVDLQMGGIDGIETAQRLEEIDENAAVLIVTGHPGPRQLQRALAAGVKGFLPKTSSAEEFAQAIRIVHSGRRWVDPDLAATALVAGHSPLTEREAEVLQYAGTGMDTAAIALAVHLAPGTTRNYLSSAMSKLGAGNRIEAYRKAKDEGWL
ncbi:response regulator transcription factor [Corynebacterium sputi]|uniref:response regulator transcription factor n=1 Tax=Corynebacterium sputi TaxID=489915 RepID=UPI000406FE18|nr:response regulator transcription factor [Corynebacterium sputi]